MGKEYISHMERLLREREEEIEKIREELINTKIDLRQSNDELYVIKATLETSELYSRAEETFELRRHVERLQQKIAQLIEIIKKERTAAAAAAYIPNVEEEIDSSQVPSQIKNTFKTRSRHIYDVDNKIYFIEGECSAFPRNHHQKKGKGKLDNEASGSRHWFYTCFTYTDPILRLV